MKVWKYQRAFEKQTIEGQAINNNGIKKKQKRDKKTNNDECYSRNASCAQN